MPPKVHPPILGHRHAAGDALGAKIAGDRLSDIAGMMSGITGGATTRFGLTCGKFENCIGFGAGVGGFTAAGIGGSADVTTYACATLGECIGKATSQITSSVPAVSAATCSASEIGNVSYARRLLRTSGATVSNIQWRISSKFTASSCTTSTGLPS